MSLDASEKKIRKKEDINIIALPLSAMTKRGGTASLAINRNKRAGSWNGPRIPLACLCCFHFSSMLGHPCRISGLSLKLNRFSQSSSRSPLSSFIQLSSRASLRYHTTYRYYRSFQIECICREIICSGVSSPVVSVREYVLPSQPPLTRHIRDIIYLLVILVLALPVRSRERFHRGRICAAS